MTNAGAASIHYRYKYVRTRLTITRQHDNKTKIVVFYFLSNAILKLDFLSSEYQIQLYYIPSLSI